MSNPFGMTDEETLDCMGPSWADMSEGQRLSYPHQAGAEPVSEPEPEPMPEHVPTSRALAARERLAKARGA